MKFTYIIAAFLGVASAIQIRSPDTTAQKKDIANTPEVRPDVYDIVSRSVDPLPLARKEDPPTLNPSYAM